MTLRELNENINQEQGLVVYLDKSNKTFRFADPKDAKQRGLTTTIRSKRDYDKITKHYKMDSEFDKFSKISNDIKKKNKDPEMRRALAAMQMDLVKQMKK